MYIKLTHGLIQGVVAFTEPGNAHLGRAIIVKMKESSTHHAAEQTAGQLPNLLAEILYQPVVDAKITINSKITEQYRSAPEGTWVQGGGLELPCLYEVFLTSSSLPDLKASLKEKLSALKHNLDGTARVQDYSNQSTESFVILFWAFKWILFEADIPV